MMISPRSCAAGPDWNLLVQDPAAAAALVSLGACYWEGYSTSDLLPVPCLVVKRLWRWEWWRETWSGIQNGEDEVWWALTPSPISWTLGFLPPVLRLWCRAVEVHDHPAWDCTHLIALAAHDSPLHTGSSPWIQLLQNSHSCGTANKIA